jgi:transposase
LVLTVAPGHLALAVSGVMGRVVGRVKSVPVVVADAGFEESLDRVAAVDVAKASGQVCLRVPAGGSSGRRVTTTWEVAATTGAIIELGDHLRVERVERVVVESTSDYWRPFVYLLQAAGLTVWLVNARDVKNVPGRPKTDKLDSVWLAKLNERGMLRPSFVPPVEIRQLRDYTRLRADLTAERTRHKQRVEKLLEDALIKVSTVTSDLFGVSGMEMMKALIAGQRNPQVLAELAKGRLRIKRAALVEALEGRFDTHHAEIAQMLLDQIESLDTQIARLTTRIDQLITALPAAQAPPAPPPQPGRDNNSHDNDDGAGGVGPGGAAFTRSSQQRSAPLPALDRLAEITGLSRGQAGVVIAEIGLDMSQFPASKHLVSWVKLAPQTIQSGPRSRAGHTGKGNPYLKAVLGAAAATASRTTTFLGDRYRRLVKRRGKLKALVAVARSILTIIWHLLANPYARYTDLGQGYHDARIDKNRKTRNHVRQLESLGYQVTLTASA